MMLHGSLSKRIAGVVIAVAMLFTISPSVFATPSQEDPEIAEKVFNGISLLKYYSDALDFLLQKNPAEVEARLEKMPFANIPQSLEESTGNFATSGIEISHLAVAIDEDLDKLRGLLGQSRSGEATRLATGTFARLSQAYSDLEVIEQATETASVQLKVSSTPERSGLRRALGELMNRIERIRQMLDLSKSLLLSLFLNSETIGNISTEQLETVIEKLKETGVSEEVIRQMRTIAETLKKGGISAEEAAKVREELAAVIEKLKEPGVSEELLDILVSGKLLPTALTLKVEPTIAFVGDNISFEGVLASGEKPLAGREIAILLNSSQYATVQTDVFGHYQRTLAVPYWYLPEINVQALYFPQGKDGGLYLAALSAVSKLQVLFYEAELKVTLEDKAYPGRETTVAGRFDYAQFPPLKERKAEIYFDNALSSEVVSQEAFTQKIRIDPVADVGEHLITVSAAAAGRYAPVAASAVLKVTRATPILDIDIPRVALIPGNIGLRGKLYSEVGTLSEASVKMVLGKSQVELVSSQGGGFDTKIRVGMGFGLIGWQDLLIEILPREPWHTPLNTTRSVLMVNVINWGGILAILVFLGIYLPGVLRRRLGVYVRRRVRTAPVIVPPEIAPVYSDATIPSSSAREGGQAGGEPRSRIFYWYRLVARLILGITRALFGPQQTLREFADQSSRVLGPLAQYFIELTKMVERLLYSQYRPTEEDAEKSRELSDTVEEGLKGEGV